MKEKNYYILGDLFANVKNVYPEKNKKFKYIND
jgi:hypothetical protein